jgi:hypothetical protein
VQHINWKVIDPVAALVFDVLLQVDRMFTYFFSTMAFVSVQQEINAALT